MCAIFLRIAILYAFCGVCCMEIATYYVYLEGCQDRFCYAVREMNVTYNTETQNVTLLCTTPMPLDEEETLPRALVKAANFYESVPTVFVYSDYQPCNDTTPLLLEFISGQSHVISVEIAYYDFQNKQLNVDTGYYSYIQEIGLNPILLNFQPNGSVTVMKPMYSKAPEKTNLTFNETSYQCSIYEDVDKRACFCKENQARLYCLRQEYHKLDPSRKGSEYYHIYGRLIMDQMHYNYYFEVTSVYPFNMYVQRYSASVLLESGGEESMELCVSNNGSAAEAEYNWHRYCLGRYMEVRKVQSNFTVFAKFHDDNWHSLMWFDYLRWSKSYDPGNCSYEEQVLDGVVHPFAICMRRNVTEKFYKNITQVDQTSSTLRITTDYAETSESINGQSTIQSSFALLDQDDIEEDLSRIAEMRNISGEIVTDVLSILDTYLNSTELASNNDSSRILQSLNSIITNSCCDIDFIGDWNLVVRRHTISCLKTDPNEWPVMNEVPKNYFDYREAKAKSQVSIEIPHETVCSERKNHEYILIYYLFSNQDLFVEKSAKHENACELRKRHQQNTPVLSAQLIDKLSMETIHLIDKNKEYKVMAKIAFPVQLSAKLHGSTKLVYWEGEKWIDAKNTKMLVENDRYVFLTTHLTDFTLVVDGLEMDPILCDVALDFISVMINFLSFVGLLMLIGHLSLKRYLPDHTFKKECSMGRNLQKIPSKYENIRLNYFVALALFHLGFLLLSDSRDLIWPMTCDSAAMVLYWLLLTCILITTFQSLHILKILTSNSSFENLLIYVIGRKCVLFITLGFPTVIVLILKVVLSELFDRQDYFCWIRPDYVVPAVILPLGFLGLNSTFIFCVIFIRIASQGSIFGIYVRFGQSSVRTIISTSTASTKSDISSASLISNGAKYMEKAFTLLCIQLMLGIPWICQYLTLFAPQLTAAHYIFTIVIGSQGLIFFMLFCYRKIKSRYS
ncbi:MeTHuselah like protein [Ditylenchus destructor]|uniref:MeTHuselah like protein n=1 Tax=Ditylenchus destructor TaxID=166010 RepID=A0AAD4MLF6_9BILA|nr:MeTHuselah like protein [Ditylenchus destructor]